ncbi:MAG: hypothetical protein FJ104_04860, partial [Deltaproteobacteria bacterium]|nr:hypothetical protein [Deltaproteobacteria bacterium]
PHVRTGRLEAYGPPCNRASRLAKAAAAGQSLVDSGTAALAGPGLTVPLHDLGERRFRGVDEPLRVLQIGGGHHPPVRSESYTAELVDYMRSPTGNVTRARALLGLMDAHGVDAVPLLGDVVAERGKVQAMLDAGLAERSAEEASSRVTAGAPPR